MLWNCSIPSKITALPFSSLLLCSIFLLGCGPQESGHEPPGQGKQTSTNTTATISPATHPAPPPPSRIGAEPRDVSSTTHPTVIQPQSTFQSEDLSVQASVQTFFSASPEVQSQTIDSLFDLGSPEALKGVIFILQHLHPSELKTRACQKLSEADTLGLRDFLVDLIPSTDPDTSRALALAVGAQADSALVMRLVERFDATSDEQIKQGTQLMMSAVSSPQAMQTLAAIVTDPLNGITDPLVAAAAQALARSANAPSVDTLLQKMNSAAESSDSTTLADLISSISSPAAESALGFAAKGNKATTNLDVRLAAVRALANFPTPESRLVLQQLQSDPNPAIRQEAQEISRKMDAPTVASPDAPSQ